MDVVILKFNVEATNFNVVVLPAALDFFVAELTANGQNWTRERLLAALKDGGSIEVTATEQQEEPQSAVQTAA